MAATIYKAADGQRLPSVTTINKIGQEADGLVWWAWNLGIQGKDYREERDNAASRGTAGHALIAAAVEDLDEPDLSAFTEEQQALARKAYSGFLEWRQRSRMRFVKMEIGLVSERHRYGGTMDGILQHMDTGQYGLGEIKTGRLYPDHLCQMAGYDILWHENYPDRPLVDGAHLMRFNLESGGFTHIYVPDLTLERETFLMKRALHDKLKLVKARL